MENIEKFLHNYDAGKVLDLATGQGNFLPFIFECKSFFEVIAVDTDERLVPFFKKQYKDKKVTYQLADAYNLPFSTESFDTVSLSNSIHHFAEPEKVLAEVKRVLKKDGHLLINEMYGDNLSKSQKSHKKLHHFSAKIDRTMGRFHADTYTKEQLKDFIVSQGFEQEELIDYTYPAGDVFEKGLLDNLTVMINRMKENIQKEEKLESLLPEAEEIEEYIKENGYASASSIFYVGKKK